MKLIDCFMYFDEDMLLDIRLHTLKNYVDRFIIAEGTLNHAGDEKKLNFDIKNFTKYKDKIEYLIIDNIPVTIKNFKKHWHPAHARDQFQRNSLAQGYKKFHDEDLIMISDLDEIPNPDKINEFKDSKYGCFVQKNFSIKFNLLNITQPDWYGTRICKKKYLKSPQWLREIKIKKRPFYKFYKPKFDKFIKNGGWHFSSVKTAEQISHKLSSYAEQQYNNNSYNTVEIIKNKIQNKLDLFDRQHKFEVVNINENLPKIIRENIKKYEEFLYL